MLGCFEEGELDNFEFSDSECGGDRETKDNVDNVPPHFVKLNSDEIQEQRKVKYISCKLNEGDLLYMPQGWFHEVHSYTNTDLEIDIHMALNAWFHPPAMVKIKEFLKKTSSKSKSEVDNLLYEDDYWSSFYGKQIERQKLGEKWSLNQEKIRRSKSKVMDDIAEGKVEDQTATSSFKSQKRNTTRSEAMLERSRTNEVFENQPSHKKARNE